MKSSDKKKPVALPKTVVKNVKSKMFKAGKKKRD